MPARKPLTTERVDIDSLKPHPRNVRKGVVPSIVDSLKAHGQYRPIVVQKSTGYVIAGNHTWRAAKQLKWKQIDVVKLNVNADQALRIMLADNQTSDLAVNDDAALTELLKALAESEGSLAGTGFTQSDLDSLLRLEASLKEGFLDAEGEWAGMPGFDQPDRQSAAHVTIHFPTEEDCEAFFRRIERPRLASMWWPNSDGLIGSSRVTDQYLSGE